MERDALNQQHVTQCYAIALIKSRRSLEPKYPELRCMSIILYLLGAPNDFLIETVRRVKY